MEIMNSEIKRKVESDIIDIFLKGEYKVAIRNISKVLTKLYNNIPDNKRISYGRVYTIKELSEYLYTHLLKKDTPIFKIASNIFEESCDSKSKGIALSMLSFCGLKDYKKVLKYF